MKTKVDCKHLTGKKGLCKSCIWERTIKPLTKHFFECKGTGRLMAVTDECEAFEHKDYPKKIEL